MAERTQTNTIGIILPSISTSSHDKVFDMLSNRFQALGYRVIIMQTDWNYEREKDAYQYLSDVSDCILTISSAENYSQISDFVPEQIPVIFLFHKPEGCPRTCILESDYSASYQGIVSYASHAYPKVACVCGSLNLTPNQEAMRAYKNALEAMEVPVDDNLIFEIGDNTDFDPLAIVRSLAEQDCHAVFATSPELTDGLMDSLLFHNTNLQNSPIALLGYGIMDSILTSHMHIDLITHPTKQVVDLAIQQATYLMHHPDFKNERVFRLKGTLQMHTYNGLNLQDHY